ncbi:MAG: RND transporter [Nitrospirota bacterium]
MKFLDKIPWSIVIIGCLSLGLAPFFPPHIWEKILMLSRGELVRPIDWFDLVYHAIPWLLLALKAAASFRK